MLLLMELMCVCILLMWVVRNVAIRVWSVDMIEETVSYLIFEVRAGRIFANRFEFGLKPNPVDSMGEL
jgi:hypothetical protein